MFATHPLLNLTAAVHAQVVPGPFQYYTAELGLALVRSSTTSSSQSD